MAIYENKLVNTIETLWASLSNLADMFMMLAMVKIWTLLIWKSEVKGQGNSGHTGIRKQACEHDRD